MMHVNLHTQRTPSRQVEANRVRPPFEIIAEANIFHVDWLSRACVHKLMCNVQCSCLRRRCTQARSDHFEVQYIYMWKRTVRAKVECLYNEHYYY